MLLKILQAAIDPPSADLAELAAELDTEGGGRTLSVADTAERVLMVKLSAKPLLAERLKYLRLCMVQVNEVRRDAKFPPLVLEQLPKVAQMVGNYGALCLTCAELFGSEPLPPGQAATTLVQMWQEQSLPMDLLARIAESVEEDQALAVFGLLLHSVVQKLQGRDLVDQKTTEVNWIVNLCATKGPLAKLLTRLPAFRPPPGGAPPPQNFMQRPNASPPGEGFRLQTESLLGYILAPTCLDTGLYKDKSARQLHFQNIRGKSRPAVQSSQSLLRHSLQEVLRQANSIINPLFRTDNATRQMVLGWFGAIITGTQSRTKSANTLDQGGGPGHFVQSLENSPMPMQSNLDMVLSMQSMQAKMQGFATPGMAVNTFWCLLQLAKPIKMDKAPPDPFYILQTAPEHVECIGGFKDEARFGDNDEVEAAKAFAESNGLLVEPKFTTQIFWLAVRAMHVMLVPVLKEEVCFAYAVGYFQPKDMAKFEAALGEHFLHETIFDSSAFLQDLAAFLNLEIAVCLLAAFPDNSASINAGRWSGGALPEHVSVQWSVLPSCIVEDIVEVLEYYITIRPPGQPVSELFQHLNKEHLLVLMTLLLGSGDHVKNANLRGKATTILQNLSKQGPYRHLLETSPAVSGGLVPACVCVFTAVEKTKQSYYDIRMQLKYQLRIPVMELMEMLLPIEPHKVALKHMAETRADEFLKFLNQMMNDATMQLEEGLDTLGEIRKLVREGGEAALARPANEQLEQDEQNEDGQDVYRRSRADPKEHCKTYMKMGNRTIRTLWSITREAPLVIVQKLNVLQQMMHNCLNPCLNRLVGPRCLELKGASHDFEEFNFKPKELLQMIAEMYVFVGRADKDRVHKMIIEDGRSYASTTFLKAVKILRRENMIGKEMLGDFENFVQELNALSQAQEEALANVEIPDNYLDPIMAEIMVDPVLLPTSSTIMDRKVIERHIMSCDDDPFNRAHLAVADLVPQVELQQEIQAFCSKHGIAFGGDAGEA